MTPYKKHSESGHRMVSHSPNGIDLIEECCDCFSRFIHNPSIGYPVSMGASMEYIVRRIKARKENS